jgi:hypothetical protein
MAGSASELRTDGGAPAVAGRWPVVDIANFFLIWGTLALALARPFELFLFSYIVLGPLHYLTEINWLDKQNYFLREKNTRPFLWAMGLLAILMTLPMFAYNTDAWSWTKGIHDAIYGTPDSPIAKALKLNWILILLAFVGSAAWLFTDRWTLRLGALVFCLVSSLLFYAMPPMAVFFGILLPTIIHVFIFTILFMWFGSLKARSGWGYANIISMPLVAVVIALWPVTVRPGSVSQSVIEMTFQSAFQKVNFTINHLLGNTTAGRIDFYSVPFFKVQSFLAFAYTYHYLNWFSKTSIIKWHRVEKRKLLFSGALWAASLALYKVDFRLGFSAVSALSVFHVILEFPLNIVSMRGILRAMGGRPATAQAAAT